MYFAEEALVNQLDKCKRGNYFQQRRAVFGKRNCFKIKKPSRSHNVVAKKCEQQFKETGHKPKKLTWSRKLKAGR
jgi:hypothetical protein